MSISYFLIKVSAKINSIDDINDNNILEIDSKAEIIDLISKIYSKVSYDDIYYYFPGDNKKNTLILAGNYF